MQDWPYYQQDEIDAVVKVLQSGKPNYHAHQEGVGFENEFAEWHGVEHAVAVANGTVALDLALHSLGIGPGDEVIVTPRTFIASISSIIQSGAKPVFADVDLTSQNITPNSAKAVLSPRTKAIMTVHLAGWPCDMPGFQNLANEYNLLLIEDCAQAHGASINGKYVGTFGDAAAFSFCTDKIMSTGGEGGMVFFKEKMAWQKAWSFKDHGKDWGAVYTKNHPEGFRWLHESIGTNWRLTEMSSAIGRCQLRKLSTWLNVRRNNAKTFDLKLDNCSAIRCCRPESEIEHSYYRYYVFLNLDQLKPDWTRNQIITELRSKGIPCMQGSCSEVYLEKAFNGKEYKPDIRLANARELGETSLSFPIHHNLSTNNIETMANTLLEVLECSTI